MDTGKVIKELESNQEILDGFVVMKQLRTHLDENNPDDKATLS